MGIGRAPNKRLSPFYRRLGPEFDQFARRGTTLVHRPVTNLIVAFHFDPTVLGTDLRWLHYFVDPLYIPKDYLALSFGRRIPQNPNSGLEAFPVSIDVQDEQKVQATICSMTEVGLPCLSQMMTLEGFFDYLNAWGKDSTRVFRPWWFEALAYTAVLLAKPASALESLKGALNFYRDTYGEDPNTMQPWQHEQIARIRLIENLLTRGQMIDAIKQLEVWEQFSISALGLRDLVET